MAPQHLQTSKIMPLMLSDAERALVNRYQRHQKAIDTYFDLLREKERLTRAYSKQEGTAQVTPRVDGVKPLKQAS